MKHALLRFLRVTERPDPPPGSGPTLTVFRASERFFYLGAAGWLFKQIGALAGLLFSLALFSGAFVGMAGLDAVRDWMDGVGRVRFGPLEVEGDLMDLVSVVELFAFGVFVVQLVVSAAFLRLGWEMRWYMVSDESLRIREGLWTIREQTMTVANIQNMAVRQGPIQKLLGIADLEVHTAGGGATSEGSESGDKTFHVGRFRGIDDAEGLRDRLRLALARHRDAGLGDPEDVHEAHDVHDTGEPATGPGSPSTSGELLSAAAALRDEARALRAAAQAAFG
jgi:hypothetical protein